MLNQIKTLIIDNDPKIIDQLKTKLSLLSHVHIVGEANTNCQGIQLIQVKSPDLLFLNIEMPGRSGFELIKNLKNQHIRLPFIIFITIHPEFTLEALRAGAVDYLLKPINEDELTQAVNRASGIILKGNQQYKIDYLHEYVSKYKQIFLPSLTGYKSINIKDIIYIRKNNETTRIELIFGEAELLVLPQNYSLAQLIDILPKSDFFQIKRELLINIRYVTDIEVYNKACTLQKGDYTVKLSMSRRSLKEFKDRMVI